MNVLRRGGVQYPGFIALSFVVCSCICVCFGALFRFVAVVCCAVVCRLALFVALCCWLGNWESTCLHFGMYVEMT